MSESEKIEELWHFYTDLLPRLNRTLGDIQSSLNAEMKARLKTDEELGILKERVIALEGDELALIERYEKATEAIHLRLNALESREVLDIESFRFETEAIDQRLLALEAENPSNFVPMEMHEKAIETIHLRLDEMEAEGPKIGSNERRPATHPIDMSSPWIPTTQPSGLVERVAGSISRYAGFPASRDAREAIAAVADWLEQKAPGYRRAAVRLRAELDAD